MSQSVSDDPQCKRCWRMWKLNFGGNGTFSMDFGWQCLHFAPSLVFWVIKVDALWEIRINFMLTRGYFTRAFAILLLHLQNQFERSSLRYCARRTSILHSEDVRVNHPLRSILHLMQRWLVGEPDNVVIAEFFYWSMVFDTKHTFPLYSTINCVFFTHFIYVNFITILEIHLCALLKRLVTLE